MIELKKDALHITFPDDHPRAELTLDFQRTLRIPDDGKDHHLPPGLGRFPVRLVDDYLSNVPPKWVDHGGVMLPMYQSEALWINFMGRYPFAIKIAAGKINAVTGEAWLDRPQQTPQDYVIVPEQPWLDGFAVEEGVIRQFVAMPLGAGYSAEEQLTGEAEFGGLQIVAYPMKEEAVTKYPEVMHRLQFEGDSGGAEGVLYSGGSLGFMSSEPDMGLAPGGRMRQQIFDDPFDFDDWDLAHSARCFVHLSNSMVWRQITGQDPPTVPPTALDYTRAGLPWFDYYDEEAPALPGSDRLDGIKSIREMGEEKGDKPLPENQSVDVSRVIEIRRGMKPDQVREGRV